jgi:hypothetical protein
MCHFIPQSSSSQNLVEEMKQTSHKCLCNPELIYNNNYRKWAKIQISMTSMVSTSKVYKHTLAYLYIYMLVKNLLSKMWFLQVSFSFIVWSLVFNYLSQPSLWVLGFQQDLVGKSRLMPFGAWYGGIESSHLFSLVTFFLSKSFNHITMDTNVFHLMSRQVIVVSLAISRLSCFQNTSLITTANLLQVIDF